MTPINIYIKTLETQLVNMPNGYVKETVEACLNLAIGIKESYENINYDISNEPNQD
jgi:hypothetical protein